MGSISKLLKATGVFLVTVFLVMIPFQIFNVLLVRNGTTATSLDSTVRGEMIVALIVAFFVSRKYSPEGGPRRPRTKACFGLQGCRDEATEQLMPKWARHVPSTVNGRLRGLPDLADLDGLSRDRREQLAQ
jgi:hypothetical protein